MIYTGIDIIEIDRVAAVLGRYPQRFLDKVYTPGEQAYCRGRAPQLASRFAAKEAVMKMLGTGVRGVPWKDVEVVRERGRAPEIVLHRKARAVGDRLGIVRIALSISHSKDNAVASVVGETAAGTVPGDAVPQAQRVIPGAAAPKAQRAVPADAAPRSQRTSRQSDAGPHR